MRWTAPLLAALAVGSSWIGCSSDAGEATGWSAEAEAFAKDFCALHEPCCASAPEVGCVARAKAYAQGKAFDAVRAKACLEGLRAAAKDASFCVQKQDVVACLAIWKSGQTPAGQACTSHAACASTPEGDGLCVGSGKTATCRAVTRGVPGTACVGTRANGATDELLAPSAGASALCFLSDGLQCDGTAKVCAPRGAVGATCSAGVGACVDEAWCPRDTKQCSTRIAKDGACTETEGCVAGDRCATNEDGASVCLPFAKMGEPCERGDECDPALVCDAATTSCVADVSLAEAICTGAADLGL